MLRRYGTRTIELLPICTFLLPTLPTPHLSIYQPTYLLHLTTYLWNAPNLTALDGTGLIELLDHRLTYSSIYWPGIALAYRLVWGYHYECCFGECCPAGYDLGIINHCKEGTDLIAFLLGPTPFVPTHLITYYLDLLLPIPELIA